MKKYISLFLLAMLCVLPSCDILKEELGIEDEEKPKDENKGDQKPQVNVNKSPCAYFTFDGNYDDLSGNDKYAYGNPEPSFVNGPVSGKKAIAFSRANMTKVVINDGLIDSPSMTVSFWLKDVSEGDIFWVTSTNAFAGSTTKMMSLKYTNGHLKYTMKRSNNHSELNGGRIGNFTHKVIDDGDWHHIVLVSDFNVINENMVTTSLYIDGVLMDTLTESYSTYDENQEKECHFGTGTKFIIGGDNTPNMKIANLRVYDEWQLPASEIKNLYTKKL
ncbi:MAG: LamG domain-containing protein [Muribaculaceae bacterium]|nr:LamG domain-containing protein [Muribaculaceae bacterium]